MAADRKGSPLFGDAAPWEDDVAISAPESAVPPAPAAEPVERHEAPEAFRDQIPPPIPQVVVPIREHNRKRTSKKVDDFDLVSFNCKLPSITRRNLRRFAADQDVDLQDVVNDAVITYLAQYGIQVPRDRAQRDAMRPDQG